MIRIILVLVILILFCKLNFMHSIILRYINTRYCSEPQYVKGEYECQNLHMFNKPQK